MSDIENLWFNIIIHTRTNWTLVNIDWMAFLYQIIYNGVENTASRPTVVFFGIST